jgi:hypothetical protein
MGLARNWLGGVLKASGLTLLIPFGLVMAIAVAATVGGTPGGVGRLGQLFEGPGIPPAAQAQAQPQTQADVPGRTSRGLSFAPLPAVPISRPGVQTALRPARTPAATVSPKQRPSRTGRTRVVALNQPRQHVTVAPPAPPPAPPVSRPPSALRRVVDPITGLVRRVPVVGKPTADAVDTVIALLDPPPQANTRGRRMSPRIAGIRPQPATPAAPAPAPSVIEKVAEAVDAITTQP